MKKLIIIAAIAIASSFVNAAQCNWSFTGLAADNSGTAWTGYHAYLCDSSVYTSTALAESLLAGNFGVLETDGFVLATAGTIQQGTSELAKIDAAVSFGDFAAGASKSFYTLVLNADGAAATEFMTSVTVTKSVPGTGKLAMSFTNISTTAGASEWQAIPEPTSGLLMLLGMAGLALRRRRA